MSRVRTGASLAGISQGHLTSWVLPERSTVTNGPLPTSPEIRMSGEVGSGPFVTVLRSGNTQLVKCPCEIPASEAPVLTLDMPVTQASTLWVRALQAMFNDEDPQAFPRSRITGRYDPFTADLVTSYQQD